MHKAQAPNVTRTYFQLFFINLIIYLISYKFNAQNKIYNLDLDNLDNVLKTKSEIKYKKHKILVENFMFSEKYIKHIFPTKNDYGLLFTFYYIYQNNKIDKDFNWKINMDTVTVLKGEVDKFLFDFLSNISKSDFSYAPMDSNLVQDLSKSHFYFFERKKENLNRIGFDVFVITRSYTKPGSYLLNTTKIDFSQYKTYPQNRLIRIKRKNYTYQLTNQHWLVDKFYNCLICDDIAYSGNEPKIVYKENVGIVAKEMMVYDGIKYVLRMFK